MIVFFKWPLFNGVLNMHIQTLCSKKMVSEVGKIKKKIMLIIWVQRVRKDDQSGLSSLVANLDSEKF